MTNEEKQLLIKDLCARLPYGVKILNKTFRDAIITTLSGFDGFKFIMKETYQTSSGNEFDHSIFHKSIYGYLDSITPYLRPMSSMTEEEYDCFIKILGRSMVCRKCYDWHEQWIQSPSVEEYLNAHHFDYRNLIEKGLALEAPEGMYNIKD